MTEIKKSQETTSAHSDRLQHSIQGAFRTQRGPSWWIKNLLHGTFFGHPLHPAITDIPIGSWILATLFDLIWLLSPNRDAWTVPAALVAISAGLLGALGSVVTGLVDWSYTSGAKRHRGFQHAVLNTGAILCYLVSGLVRFFAPSGNHVLAVLLGFLGLGLVLVAAYLGGNLVFARGVAVNPPAWERSSGTYESEANHQ